MCIENERVAIMRKIGTNLGGIAVGEIMVRFVRCCMEENLSPIFDLDGLFRLGRDVVFTFEDGLLDLFGEKGESIAITLLNPSEKVSKSILGSDFLRAVCIIRRQTEDSITEAS